MLGNMGLTPNVAVLHLRKQRCISVPTSQKRSSAMEHSSRIVFSRSLLLRGRFEDLDFITEPKPKNKNCSVGRSDLFLFVWVSELQT
jgi:hypothetical protein